MFKSKISLVLLILFLAIYSYSQELEFTHQDTLRGSITPEREWWDLTFYHLNVEAFPEDSSLKGNVVVQYRVLEEHQRMQIDLQEPMQITSVLQNDKAVEFSRLGNVYYLELSEKQNKGEINSLDIYYEGKPKVSLFPPWDGGVAWRTDDNMNSFIATSCQGAGASLWWPCKDHMYDEPDGMKISITVPKDLTVVGNGWLAKVDKNRKDKTRTFHWLVSNPINNYGVNMNIGDYAHFSEVYTGEKGDLNCE